MNGRVLFVDDEPQVLDGIQRSLRKQVDIVTTTSAAEGLRLLAESGPFALVVSDMRMPVMNGAQFLAKARECKPETVRIILSGQSDLQATIAAVNEGHIYRFLHKPCNPEQLLAAIEDGLNQHRLITAEKVLLEQTLSGCVAMLIEILGMVSPSASSRASRLQRYTMALANALELGEHWQWPLAAYVSQIGCVALPKEILSKVEAGQELTEEERRLHESHPDVAHRLLASIPRMEEVADIVTAQFGPTAFCDALPELHRWDVRSMGRLLLRGAVEFDRLAASGLRGEAAVTRIKGAKLGFPSALIEAMRSIVPSGQDLALRQLRLADLSPGMMLDEDLVSSKGIRLVPAGHEVTRSLIVRLKSIATGVGVAEPFRVRVSL